VKIVTVSFETSPNTKPTRKSGGDMAYYVPPVWKSGGTRPPCPHQIAPMCVGKKAQSCFRW